MIWRVYWKGGSSQKFYISGQLWNGKRVKLPGYGEKKLTEALRDNIESLNRSKMFNRLPDENLAGWIAGLPKPQAERYVQLGLLDRVLLESHRPLEEIIVEFVEHVRINNRPSSGEAKIKNRKIRRTISAMKSITSFEDLTLDKILKAVNEMTALTHARKGLPISQTSRRGYLQAFHQFCCWLVAKKYLKTDPMVNVVLPSSKTATVHNRYPLTVDDFKKLIEYVLQAPPTTPSGRRCIWLPRDRALTYWMAVLTGFRVEELKSLTPASINFDVSPATVTVKADVAKNKRTATVPLDHDLAKALKRAYGRKKSTDPLLNMPKPSTVTDWLYRDMDAAEVRRKAPDGSLVDFHALRSTAICWWLNVNKLDLLEAKSRSRLDTLDLVQQYSQRFQPKHEQLLRNAPRIIDPESLR